MEEEGLFRLNGAFGQINAMKDAFDSGKVPDLEEAQDSHVVGSLLKLYLRELPEPLCTYDLYDGFVAACNKERDAMVFDMKYLFTQLPMSNRLVIQRLVKFLGRVGALESKNKMSVVNLATVFGPNILRPKTDNPLQMMAQSPWVSKAVMSFVTEYDALFGEVEKQAAAMASASSSKKTGGGGSGGSGRKAKEKDHGGKDHGGKDHGKHKEHKEKEKRSAGPGAGGSKRDGSARRKRGGDKTEKITKITYARAAYTFKPRNEKEIGFDKGDTIIVHRQNPNGWWQGQDKAGKVGLFPGNFVVLVESHDGGAAQIRGKAVQAKALYKYEPRNEKELGFNVGDVITVVLQNPNGWWQGQHKGKMGLFPANYCRVIQK